MRYLLLALYGLFLLCFGLPVDASKPVKLSDADLARLEEGTKHIFMSIHGLSGKHKPGQYKLAGYYLKGSSGSNFNICGANNSIAVVRNENSETLDNLSGKVIYVVLIGDLSWEDRKISAIHLNIQQIQTITSGLVSGCEAPPQ